MGRPELGQSAHRSEVAGSGVPYLAQTVLARSVSHKLLRPDRGLHACNEKQGIGDRVPPFLEIVEGVRASPVESFRLKREQWIPRSSEEVYAFFANAKNLEAITPSWLGFRILSAEPIVMRKGAQLVYRLRWHWFPMRWVTEITRWDPPTGFVDVQVKGPYSLWHHTHSFQPVDGGTLIGDTVRYALPFGLLGRLAHACVLKAELNAIFDYRARKVCELLGAPVRP
jgi:ligand-binding SRPBCC domain-containing protein